MEIRTLARPPTPTLDDSEVALNAPLPELNKTVTMTTIDLEPTQLPTDTSAAEAPEGDKEEAEDDGEGGDSDSDDDDVEITIGEITTGPGNSYSRTPNYGRVGLVAGGTGSVSKKVDVDAIPQIGGQSLLEFDLDEAAAEKPWRLPGADIADYFNYGFTEDTWKLYCEKQRKMKGEVIQLNKIVVHSSIRAPGTDAKAITMSQIPLPPPNILPPGFPPPPMPPPPAFLQGLPGMNLGKVPIADIKTESHETSEPRSPKDELGPNLTPPPIDDNASDGRATPGVDAPSSSNKPPLLPPPNIPPGGPGLSGLPPPPFGLPPPGFPPFPPGQDNLAAAMAAAMFGGGIRPPDGMPPPHMLNNVPPFLHPQGFGGAPDGLPPPPFPGMPPNFPMDPGLDDRNFSQDILSQRLLGGPFPWDSGTPPQDLLDAFSHRNHRPSRSPSTSGSSSYDDHRRRKRDRRHKRSSRSRSRSYERDRDRDREHRHRSSRHRNGENHRSDRHDRDRDRDRDRESKRRREHREEKSSRHERYRRHRSSSRGRDEERSSRKEKSSKLVEQEVSRDSSKSP